jgi:hypothetical protein
MPALPHKLEVLPTNQSVLLIGKEGNLQRNWPRWPLEQILYSCNAPDPIHCVRLVQQTCNSVANCETHLHAIVTATEGWSR